MFKIEKMDFLVSVYIFGVIVAELMGPKSFSILDLGFYKLTASVGIFLIPLLFTINDVIVEVYGPERARSVVRAGLLTIGLLFIFIINLISKSTNFLIVFVTWLLNIIEDAIIFPLRLVLMLFLLISKM